MKLPRILAFALLLASCAQGPAPSVRTDLRNPILPGFHPDPSVCRVGEDYYIVNSSFQYFPGVPVYHSTDLQNWELIGNVLVRESQLPLEKSGSWNGIYATTIRYNDGVFYMITTNVTVGKNFYVTATDPAGPWSEPIWLEQGGIDPSFYFEDGKCYFVSNPDGQITLCEIDPATGRQLTASKAIWGGTGGRFPEGPHIYRKDGWYYLLISEGGTELAHGLTIARSRRIYGPYKACPSNPIFTHCRQAAQGHQIQGTGHGDFVQAADGSWWVVFLAYRNFGGSYHHLGRETFIAPVSWEKGWPVVNGGQPVEVFTGERKEVVRHFDFAEGFGPDWLFIQNPDTSRYAVENGSLVLHGGRPLVENDHPVFVGIRQESEVMEFEAGVSLRSDGEAGISVYQIHDGHFDLAVRRRGGKHEAVALCTLKSLQTELASVPLRSASARLKVVADAEMYHLYVSDDSGASWKHLYSLNCSLLSTEVAGGFTGVVMGLYSVEAEAGFDDITSLSLS